VRPDGRELKWQTGRQATFDLPFLCGDVTPRALRVPEGDVRRHANGARGVASVGVAVYDLEASLSRYRALLGVAPGGGALPTITIGAPVVLPGLGLRVAVVTLDRAALVLMSPSGGGESGRGSTGAFALAERLATRGEGPCALAIRASGAATVGLLDRALTHEVAMEIGAWPAGSGP
jgi:hypothetical protein